VEIVEGMPLTKIYTKSAGSSFVVPNENADISSLRVKVAEGATWYLYNLATDLMNVKADSRVFFVKQREDLFYEVYFGNGAIGKAVQNGWQVNLFYNKSSGSASNGSASFNYASGFRGDVQYTITTTQVAIQGTEAETLEAIKYNAPRSFISQNRAVTSGDYASLILENHPEVESVNVWGGQDNIPRAFGKVFISAKPYGADRLNDATKTSIVNTLLAPKNVVSVLPVMVDPLYLKVQFTTSVYYNPNLARFDSGTMQSAIVNALTAYSSSLNKFESTFRFSKVTALIDALDESIVSNISTLKIHRPVTPQFVSNAQYNIVFGNPIAVDKNVGGTFTSSLFLEIDNSDPCFLLDDGNGIINMYKRVNSVNTLLKTVGTIEYEAGTVTIPVLNIRGLYDPELEFIIVPLSNDVIPEREYIVSMPVTTITVNMIVDGISTGNAEGNSNHIFSPSR
jgi:hypothetical protein